MTFGYKLQFFTQKACLVVYMLPKVHFIHLLLKEYQNIFHGTSQIPVRQILKERLLILQLTSKSRSASTIEIGHLVKACSSIVARVRPAIVPISFTMFSCIPVFAIAFIFCGTISKDKRGTVF